MKQLSVRMGELALAFESASWEMEHYLDLETGEIIPVPEEIRSQLEALYEEVRESSPDADFDLDEAMQAHEHLHDWQRQMLAEAHEVERHFGTRYIRVPQLDLHEAYRDMERFIASIQDEGCRDRLWIAIDGRGAFRRFKNVLLDYPEARERWLAFKDEQMEERVLDWLRQVGVVPSGREAETSPL